MKKFNLIILIIILSISFISCSKTEDKIDINNGYSTILANTKWFDRNSDHTMYFGTPNLSSMADGTFTDGKYSGTYKLYEDKYMNEMFTSFENCSQETQDEFWSHIKDKNNITVFGLIAFMNGNKYKRFEYFGCLDGNTLILCDYTNVYVYEKAEGNKDKLIKELNVTSHEADYILERITLMLTLDYYDIKNITKNPEYGYIVEVDILSTDKYFIYLSEEYNIMLITKDKLESDGGEITFRQKE